MTIGSVSFLYLSVKVTAICFLLSIRPLPTLKELVLSMNICPIIFLVLQRGGFLGFLMYIWIEYGRGIGSPEWLMIQIGRIGQKTGENIKKTSQIAVEKTKESIKKKKN